MTEYYSMVWIYHILFIHLSVDIHLGCFHFLAIMNNAAMNIHVQVFKWTYVLISLGDYLSTYPPTYLTYLPTYLSLGIELLGHTVTLCLIFWGSTRLFSKVAAPFYISNSSAGRFRFLSTLVNPYYYSHFGVKRWFWFSFHCLTYVCFFNY